MWIIESRPGKIFGQLKTPDLILRVIESRYDKKLRVTENRDNKPEVRTRSATARKQIQPETVGYGQGQRLRVTENRDSRPEVRRLAGVCPSR